MRTRVSDTAPSVERMLIKGYRQMSPAQKLERVAALNRALDELGRARIRAHFGDVSEREMRLRLGALRLGALRLDRRVMIDAFDWAPHVHGY